MADFASDEELLERLRKWWSENGLLLIAAVVVAVGGTLGWRWFQDWRGERLEAAAEAYGEYLDTRAAGEDASAPFDLIAAEFTDTAYHVFALLFEARDAVAAEDFERAAGHLQESVERAGEEALGDISRLRLARVLYQLDRHDAALEHLGAVRSAGFLDDVAELTGDIHWRQGAEALAREAYQAAFDAAPDAARRQYLELKLRSVPAAPEPAAGGEADSGQGAAAAVVAEDAAADAAPADQEAK